MGPEIEDNAELRTELNKVGNTQREGFISTGWWHSIQLDENTITPGVHKIEELRDNYKRFDLPHDLTGKRLLDIGCWDGFYSFEAERHGAQVTAVDVFRPEKFFEAHRAIGSNVKFYQLTAYELNRDILGGFDIVLFLGVLYHLRHPLLALDRVCEVADDVAIIESHVIDNVITAQRPLMEFYEYEELADQYDNWWGPNSECISKMARSAGFVEPTVLRQEPTRTVIKAHRRWKDAPREATPSLYITDIVNPVSNDQVFTRRGRQAYLSLQVLGLPPTATRGTVRLTIGGLAARPYAVQHGTPNEKGVSETQVSVNIPPGLSAGASQVEIFHHGKSSAPLSIEIVEGREEKAFIGL
jgi:tRNA (mo5U34)-methyltransferase